MSAIKLGDDFMRVPKLDEAGTNWVIYKDRFLWSIDARGHLDHVDGTAVAPADPVTRTGTADAPQTLTADEILLEAEWTKELKVWNQGEAIVKQQIAATISDSQFMKIRGKTTAREIWGALAGDFDKRSRMFSVDLRRRLQLECCAEQGDVRAHFATLRTMREDLAAMGQPPSEDDFYSIILGSLPPSYDPHISAISATSSVLGTTLSPDELMHVVTDEFDRRSLSSAGARKEENGAFYSNDAGGRKGGSSSRNNIECYNCGEMGHFKSECWEEGGGKEGKGPKGRETGKGKATDAAAVSKAEEEDEDAAWYAMSAFNSERDDLDKASVCSTSPTALFDDFSNLMSEDSDRGYETSEADESSGEESGCESEGESDDGSVDEEDVLMSELMNPLDSEDGEDYKHEHTSIYAPGDDAYATSFHSVALSTILCDSGASISYMRALETLGSPDVDYLPISFDEFVESGFTAALSHSGCIIRGPDGQKFGEVPWNANGLEGIEHEPGKANAEAETRTLERQDHQMRQIEPLVAQEVEKGSQTDARLYSALYDYPVVDNPWADFVSSSLQESPQLKAAPLDDPEEGGKGLLLSLDLREVRERAEEVGGEAEGEKDLERAREGINVGVPMESDVDKRPRGAQIEGKAACDKVFSSAARLEGKFGKEFGETNADTPAIHPFPSNHQFPAVNAPAQSSAPPVAEISHDPHDNPPNDAEIPLREPEIKLDGVREPAPYVKGLMEGRATTSGIQEGQRTAQEDESSTPKLPEPSAAAAADVDDAMEADIGGEQAPNCAIAAVVVDADTSTADLCDARVWEPGGVDYAKGQTGRLSWEGTGKAELAVLYLSGTRNVDDAPGRGDRGGTTRILLAKDDAMGVIKRYAARLAAQGARMPDDSPGPAVPRLAYVGAVGNFEIGQINVEAAYLKGLLTSDDPIATKSPPGVLGNPIPAEFTGKSCLGRISSIGLEDLGQLELERPWYAMYGHMEREGKWGATFDDAERRWLSLWFKMGMSPFWEARNPARHVGHPAIEITRFRDDILIPLPQQLDRTAERDLWIYYLVYRLFGAAIETSNFVDIFAITKK